jgi:hypothetical protein
MRSLIICLLFALVASDTCPTNYSNVTDFTAVPTSCIEILTPADVSTFCAAGCASISRDSPQSRMNHLSADSWSGFTEMCISNFGTGLFSPCSMNTDNWGHVTSAALAGLTEECLHEFENLAVEAFTAEQVGAISPAASAGWTASLVRSLPSASWAGWKRAQVAMWSLDNSRSPCEGVTADGFKLMTPATVAGIKGECFHNFPEAALEEATAAQIANLTLDMCEHLSADSLSKLNTPAWAGLTATCVGAWDTTLSMNGPCGSVTSAGMCSISRSLS